MLDPELETEAALYASGAMTPPERERFELILEFHAELRALVRQLEDCAAAVVLTGARGEENPRGDLRDRVLASIAERPQGGQSGLVVTNPQGFVQWVNDAFTEMCGYSLDELRGRKLGPMLQGELTDRAAAGRMRAAVHAQSSCHEELINYHKDGTPYWVRISISPIMDESGAARWLVAREEELHDRPIAA